MARAYRSVLYIPAANQRAMEKAQGLTADAIIFDLEDAVAPDAKEAARDALAQALTQDYGRRARIVRINGMATDWGEGDARACAGALADKADAVLIPKVDSAADLDRVAALIPDLPLWAMMETPLGMLNAAEIAAHPRLQGMVMGTNDLAKELNSRFRPDRLPMQSGLGLCLLAAKAYGKVIVDGVFNAFKDDEGLRAECEQGRDMGFDGKTLIHPAQLAITNQVFAPADADIDLARRQIEAFEAATREGKGVAVVDGKIVENLHVETARKTLALAEAIAEMTE
ncbi:HpcH/HpaI aldolase/citrate lyase family protein [Paracoccus fistulariae]|uniref:CoA ester lyase n=1 Tax=Paracoccus fistulariae TaxID=658446 RepID=A0ABY7SMT3_9RHOB|nr:CoA ester lyase [Paracoccus fistulariae]MDB6180131.1 CoA ester lyase [Paracoccus fistulariae]WCR08215.1 CoA ester lyase [Paracoccus fistulariae]